MVYGLCPRYPQLQGSSSAAGSVGVFIPRPAINRWVRAEAGQIHNFENRASPRNDLIKCRNPLTQEMPEYQIKKHQPLHQKLVFLRNDRENNTIRGFRFLVELSFGIWCSWVQSGCKTRRIWCTHSFRFAVISERTMARGRKKKFSDYIRTEVARIYRLLHNVGTLRRVPIFHFGCIFIGLTFLCP